MTAIIAFLVRLGLGGIVDKTLGYLERKAEFQGKQDRLKTQIAIEQIRAAVDETRIMADLNKAKLEHQLFWMFLALFIVPARHLVDGGYCRQPVSVRLGRGRPACTPRSMGRRYGAMAVLCGLICQRRRNDQRDILKMSGDVHEALGEIKGLLTGIDKKVDGLENRLEGQDERLRTVERRSWASSVVTAGVISVAVAFIKDRIGQ